MDTTDMRATLAEIASQEERLPRDLAEFAAEMALRDLPERVALLARDIISWEHPGTSARLLYRAAAKLSDIESVKTALTCVADALLDHQAHLDFEAGAEAQKKNDAALCEEAAARHAKAARDFLGDTRDRIVAKASELRTMAAYIARGDRAEGH